MAGIDYAVLRRRIAMRRILELIDYRPTLVRGEQWRGPCPIADHASASDRRHCFSVHLTRNAFTCFRCQKSGNQLDLWSAISERPLYPASVELCRRIGIDVPWLPSTRNSQTDGC